MGPIPVRISGGGGESAAPGTRPGMSSLPDHKWFFATLPWERSLSALWNPSRCVTLKPNESRHQRGKENGKGVVSWCSTSRVESPSVTKPSAFLAAIEKFGITQGGATTAAEYARGSRLRGQHGFWALNRHVFHAPQKFERSCKAREREPAQYRTDHDDENRQHLQSSSMTKPTPSTASFQVAEIKRADHSFCRPENAGRIKNDASAPGLSLPTSAYAGSQRDRLDFCATFLQGGPVVLRFSGSPVPPAS